MFETQLALSCGILMALLSTVTETGSAQTNPLFGGVTNPFGQAFDTMLPSLQGLLNTFGFPEDSINFAKNVMSPQSSTSYSPSSMMPSYMNGLVGLLVTDVPESVVTKAQCGCTSFLIGPVFDPLRSLLGPLCGLTVIVAAPLNALSPFLYPLLPTLNELAPVGDKLAPLLCSLKPLVDFLAQLVEGLLGPLLPFVIVLVLVLIVVLSPILVLVTALLKIIQMPILVPLVKLLVTIVSGLLGTLPQIPGG